MAEIPGEDNFPREEEREKYKNEDEDKWGDALEEQERDDDLIMDTKPSKPKPKPRRNQNLDGPATAQGPKPFRNIKDPEGLIRTVLKELTGVQFVPRITQVCFKD